MYTELSRFVFVVNVLFYFILFFVQDFFKNSINRKQNERQACVCRLPLNVMLKVPIDKYNLCKREVVEIESITTHV